MSSRNGHRIVWLGVFGLILVLSAGVWSAILQATDGRFAYILDDPYIHLAIARNLAESGVWGVTRYEFSGASSSLLWVAMLGLVEFVFGRAELAPLFVNVALTAVFAAMVQTRLRAFLGEGSHFKVAGLTALVLLTAPVITLIFLGMEHLLQTVLAFGFVFAAARYAARPDDSQALIRGTADSQKTPVDNSQKAGEKALTTSGSQLAVLAALAALTTAVRYEGLFQIAAVGLYFVLRKRFGAAAAIGAAGAFAPSLYALYSVAQGWPLLPTPVLLKGTLSSILNVASPADVVRGADYLIQEKYLKHIHMPILIALAALAYARNRRRGMHPYSFDQILLGIFLLTAIQHVHLAGLGWYFRYEAYLVSLAVVLLAGHYFGDRQIAATAQSPAKNEIAPLRPKARGWRRVLLAAFVLVCVLRMSFSLGWRALVSVAGLPGSAREIYTQQMQSARFFDRYYRGQTVAANDIGAINYFADIRCLDLFGLANYEVADLRKKRTFTTRTIEELSARAGVRVAIVYDAWFERAGGLPANWRKAGEWTIPERTTVAQDTVAIYAVNADYATVVRQLQEFGAKMPTEIKQNVPYRPRAKAASENEFTRN